jgi:hypothetical protein
MGEGANQVIADSFDCWAQPEMSGEHPLHAAFLVENFTI